MDRHIDQLPQDLQDRVRAKVQSPPGSLGAAIGELVDEALADGWTYDRTHDQFVKVEGGEQKSVMVKVVWRAYVEERGGA